MLTISGNTVYKLFFFKLNYAIDDAENKDPNTNALTSQGISFEVYENLE
jgi:hypothetical protein